MFTVDYFIKKFEAIPEELWIEGNSGTEGYPRCANGHTYKRNWHSDETAGLYEVFKGLRITPMHSTFDMSYVQKENIDCNYSRKAEQINNGNIREYPQPTPKQRILAALYDIKKMQEPAKTPAKAVEQPGIIPAPQRIIYVAIDAEVKKLGEEVVMS